MGLNIKNREVELLADELARMTGESKTEAIRRSLQERRDRLVVTRERRPTKESLIRFMERSVWSEMPPDVLGKPISKREREKILGYGPHGV